ncbi:MAG: hypothetical protein IT232_00285 [Flavobacteriales bacterium]|nr:hypothetical protein [Flavobacteriales bacterium]
MILQLFYFTNTLVSQTSVGYFNYGRSGKMSWSNHLSINSLGQLVMAGTFDDKANFIVANSSGTYSTNRTVAGTGELFSAVVDASGNIFVGGCHGAVWTNPAKTKYIVKYTSAMTQSYAKQFGLGTIRYLTTDGTDIVATGYNTKPCVIKLDNAGNTIWYKEYTVDGKDGDAFSIVKIGTNYYVAGNIKEAGANRGYVMSIDAATGNVNWCNTYNSAGNPPHLTGMSKSSTGLILCGATGLMGSGKLMAMKIDFSGNLVWSRLINSCYSWYEKDPTTYNIWSINCAVDPYGSVVVAYEDDPSYGLLAKLNETTGTVTWIKRFGNSGDGFHGITVSGCAYLASGWFGPQSAHLGIMG